MDNSSMFKPVKSPTLAEGVAEQLIALIAAGHLKPGDRLPTEAELTQQFGVGRSTLREALKSLAMAGLIETHRSSGTFVSKTYTDFLSRRLNLAALLSEREVRDIVEVRYGLEGQTAALAAKRATTDQVDKLTQILAGIDEHLANPKQAAEHDMAFHVAIAKASQNSLLLNLILSMRNLIYDYIEFGYTHPLKLNPDDGEHERILAAIRARQPEQATQAMLEHLASSAEWMLACARNTAGESQGRL